jgi:hypothetical protein
MNQLNLSLRSVNVNGVTRLDILSHGGTNNNASFGSSVVHLAVITVDVESRSAVSVGAIDGFKSTRVGADVVSTRGDLVVAVGKGSLSLELLVLSFIVVTLVSRVGGDRLSVLVVSEGTLSGLRVVSEGESGLG